MENKPEVLKIIEAGLDGDTAKLRAYANLLIGKCPDDEHFKKRLLIDLPENTKRKMFCL